MDKIYKLIDTYSKLEAQSKDKVILFVGLTGSGKSTLAQFLAGNENLTSKSVSENSKDFYISDNDEHISDATTISKTFSPTSVQLSGSYSGSVIVDCPGFWDTRGCQHEIAAALFIRRYLQNVKHAKIVFVVSHHAVRHGVDRTSFPNSLKSFTTFLPNIQKYKNSIALMVTKVENAVDFDDDDKMKLVSDEALIEGISKCIMEMRNELKTEKNSKVEEILNIFLNKKIGIMRRPNKAGSLLNMKLLQNRKPKIEKLIYQDLKFVEPTPDDFNLSLSRESEVFVKDMHEQLRTNIYQIVKDICDEVVATFAPLADIDVAECIIPFWKDRRAKVDKVEVIISQIEEADNNNFQMTSIDWLNAPNTERYKEHEAKSLKQFKYLELLNSVKPTEKNDYDNYFSLFADLKTSLNNILEKLATSKGWKCLITIGTALAVTPAVLASGIVIPVAAFGAASYLLFLNAEELFKSGKVLYKSNFSKQINSFFSKEKNN